jgi:RNA polymerase sigma-70 factor (ECF subfamily)
VHAGKEDDELVRAARAGSLEAASTLFERHWPAAWRAALGITGSRADADDVAQESFERAFGAIAAFNGRSTFRTWLLRIVVNRSLTLVRERKRVVPLVLAEEAGGERATYGVLSAVRRLEPDRRAVVALRYWLDLSPAEIATTLDLPVGTVHSRLARALDDLRRDMEVTERD